MSNLQVKATHTSQCKCMTSTGLFWLWLAFLVIAIDRVSKWWVLTHITPFEPVAILPVFNLTLVFNRGAAFSMLHSASGWQSGLLGGLAIVVSVAIVAWLYRLAVKSYWLNIGLTLILGGALGNAWDRFLYPHVIDFLDFHWQHWHFAIFNIADTAISIGAFMLMVSWFRESSA